MPWPWIIELLSGAVSKLPDACLPSSCKDAAPPTRWMTGRGKGEVISLVLTGGAPWFLHPYWGRIPKMHRGIPALFHQKTVVTVAGSLTWTWVLMSHFLVWTTFGMFCLVHFFVIVLVFSCNFWNKPIDKDGIQWWNSNIKWQQWLA